MPWVKRTDIIGGAMFIVGVGILIGWFFSDKVHGVEKFAIVAAVVLMVLGAHFISSGPTEAALKSVAGTAKDILSFAKKSDPPSGQ